MRSAALLGLCLASSACAPAVPQTVDLPAHPFVAHADAGPFDAGPDATCSSGDGCDPTCPFRDADCPDGAPCARDGVCAAGCFDGDVDCAPGGDGQPCTFGEECTSARCVFVDADLDNPDAGAALCTRPCGSAPCAPGLTCLERAPPDDAICVPASCASAAPSGLLAALLLLTLFARRSLLRAP